MHLPATCYYRYVDTMCNRRAREHPERGLFKMLIDSITAQLRVKNSVIRPQGPLRGVLYPIPAVDAQSYNQVIPVPDKVALSDIEEWVRASPSHHPLQTELWA